MLRYGRPAPDYAMSDSSSVVLILPKSDADTEFLEMILRHEEQTGSAMPIDSLIILSRLRHERRLTTADLVCRHPENRSKPLAWRLKNLRKPVWSNPTEQGEAVPILLAPRCIRRAGQKAAYVRQAGFDNIQQTQMVLSYIEKHGSIKRSEAAELCRIGNHQAHRLLKRLNKSGFIVQKGQTKGSFYIRKQ